ncbi:MAG: hypothetical protein IJQ42_09655 [Oscillospiraceae bacterium]|jgi:hypothetical protein|nr:hypothetical protein [Oscillospiraceae bacterium]
MSSFEEELEQNGTLVFPNKGKSMLPLLRENRDLMVIRKKGPERCKKYDAVLFRRGEQYVLHRILKVREKDYWIVGDNCCTGDDVRDEQILGVLTQVVRDGKTISTTDPVYRIYVHLWCDLFPLRSVLLRTRGRAYRAGSRIKRMLKR